MLSLLKDIDQFEIVLASESPRRFELLKMIGLEFKVWPSHAPENYESHLTPVDYSLNNAQLKGRLVAEKCPHALVISADTIVVHRGVILEKPHDENHAAEILRRLSNSTHDVITAFGLTCLARDKSVFDYEQTRVTFRNLKQIEIRAYINSGEPFDKAGGYGAQGSGALLIKKIEGCFFNVVGFPLSKFYIMLEKFLIEL
jgi:septum formation protein